MNYNKIGVENFRVFKDYTEFEIRPITLLTGPNNSGKSSFTKLLLLLKEGMNPLDFEKGDHNLESFDKVLNWQTNSDFLELKFLFNSTLGKNFNIRYKLKNARINSLELLNTDSTYINTAISESDFLDPMTPNSEYYNFKSSIDISKLIEVVYSMDFHINYLSQKKSKLLSKFEIANETICIPSINNLEKKIIDEDYDWIFKSNEIIDISASVLKNEIENLNKDFLLFECFIDGVNLTKSFTSDIKEIQNETFNHFRSTLDLNLKNILYAILHHGMMQAKYRLKEYFENTTESKSVKIELSKLGKLLFEHKIFDIANSDKFKFEKTLAEKILSNHLPNNNLLKRLNYISPNRGHNKRSFHQSIFKETESINLNFKKNKYTGDPYFIHKAFEILEIEGEIEVENYKNLLPIVYLRRKNEKILLSDLGFGYSQLIPIILQIHNLHQEMLYDYSDFMPQTLIIEEPESNLHPNLQSKLADIFILARQCFSGLNLIVETHSEYLIRKLQYLTVKEEIDSQKSIIYYFNSDKYVSPQEPKVKRIEINKDGNLTDTFGPGFYDESTRLQFELLKLNKEQNN